MIYSFALEFPDEASMRRAVTKLWDKLSITGEIDVMPTENGKWRMDVHSEKPIRDATIEALGGTRIKVRSAVGRL